MILLRRSKLKTMKKPALARGAAANKKVEVIPELRGMASSSLW
jgi:hypothetical protein